MSSRRFTAAALLALTAMPAHAITYLGFTTIAGNATDKSNLGSDPNLTRLGGFGSDLAYNPADGLYYGITDRGPGGGLIGYAPRIQAFSLSTDLTTGAVSAALAKTILFKQADGSNYTGLNPYLNNGNAQTVGSSYDPEGFTILANGHYLVSDEYGPSVREFAADGSFVRDFKTPANLLPKTSDGTLAFGGDTKQTVATGRQDNRGFEGLTVSPDGKYAYAALQDPLTQEGKDNNGQNSRNVRIVKFDTTTGDAVGQYIYRLENTDDINKRLPTNDTIKGSNQGKSIGISALYALPDGSVLVLERDNRGIGIDDPTNTQHVVGSKRIYQIDFTGASDVSGTSLAGANGLPAGVTAVSKKELNPFLDIAAFLKSQGVPIAEKLEGFTFSPILADGGRLLYLFSDNDFSVTQTDSGTQYDVCTAGPGSGVSSQVAIGGTCPVGQSLIPSYVYSFRLTSDEARTLGFSTDVPEPASWAMMLAGFAMIGAVLRRRQTRVRFN